MRFGDMKLALIPLGLIVQTQTNYKKMTPEQYGALRASVEAFGWKSFAVVRELDDGTYEMIDGHHRLKLAEERGLDELPCVILDDDSADRAPLARFSFNVAGEILPEVYLDAMRALNEQFGTDETAAFTGLSQNFVAGVIAQADAAATEMLGDAAASAAAQNSQAEPTSPTAKPGAMWKLTVLMPPTYEQRLAKLAERMGMPLDQVLGIAIGNLAGSVGID